MHPDEALSSTDRHLNLPDVKQISECNNSYAPK